MDGLPYRKGGGTRSSWLVEKEETDATCRWMEALDNCLSGDLESPYIADPLLRLSSPLFGSRRLLLLSLDKFSRFAEGRSVPKFSIDARDLEAGGRLARDDLTLTG